MDSDDFLWMRDRQLGQNYRIEYLEDSEVRADAKSQRKQRS